MRWLDRPLLATIAFAVVLTASLGALQAMTPQSTCTGLVVASSLEKASLMQQAAQDFNAKSALTLGWSDIYQLAEDPQGWARYGHPEWGRFRLGKTNPNISTSGLHALVGTYLAATGGKTSDLATQDLQDPKVVEFVKGVESSVVHY